MTKPIVWTIAGSDSGGGAGIQADLHTMQCFGVHGCSVITALTAQNSTTVNDIQFTSPENLRSQLDTLATDLPAHAIKLGMLGDISIMEVVAEFLSKYDGTVICDPVMVSTSGDLLLKQRAIETLKNTIIPFANCITPNIPEAQALTGLQITSSDTIEEAAKQLLSFGANSVLIKGGHSDDDYAQDYWTNGTRAFWLNSKRVDTHNTHGSGCVLSSAIASACALDHDLQSALVLAKAYVTRGLKASEQYGEGPGPVAHTCFPNQQATLPWITSTAKQGKTQYQFPALTMPNMGIYPLVDSLDKLTHCLQHGIRTVQLRLKDQNNLENTIKAAIEIANRHQAQLFINDYWELATKYNAYGVHLGQSDLEDADLSAIQRAGLRLGVSTHNYYELARVHALQPSYIAFGTVFKSPSKQVPHPVQGIQRLKQMREMIDYPLVAIGGINQSNIEEVWATGVDGVAMISGIEEFLAPLSLRERARERGNITLTQTQLTRYQRHITLDEIGTAGQKKLQHAKVLVIGAGGLGCPVLTYLAAAGVGTIGIIDDDKISLSNLHRQTLYKTDEVGQSKVAVAAKHLKAQNSDITIHQYLTRFNTMNADTLVQQYDIIADCSDNFDTRYLVNDACFNHKTPFVHASVIGFKGQCAVFNGTTGPSYRDLFPEKPTEALNCSSQGVLGSLAGVLGTLQVTLILNYFLFPDKLAYDELIIVDGKTLSVDRYRHPPTCSRGPFGNQKVLHKLEQS